MTSGGPSSLVVTPTRDETGRSRTRDPTAPGAPERRVGDHRRARGNRRCWVVWLHEFDHRRRLDGSRALPRAALVPKSSDRDVEAFILAGMDGQAPSGRSLASAWRYP